MKRRLVCGLLAALFLTGCASEWRTGEPVTALTYRVPAYRKERSVGNLRRLAILPVRVRRVGALSVITHSEKMEPTLVLKAATYLSEEKGYETVPVVDDAGVWRPEVLMTDEFGSLEELKEVWEKARTEEEVAEAMRKVGQALNVDGVVSIWLEEKEPESVADSVLIFGNFFLFNVPLFYALLHTNAEAVIYEVFSGRAIWRNQFSGDFERPAPDSTVQNLGLKSFRQFLIGKFFENLENAVPAQLTK